MRRLLALLLLLLPGPVFAQKSNWFSTKAQQEFQKALTDASFFGVPRYTTALLPTCGTTNKGALAFDTTTGGLKTCNGSAWLAGGGAAAAVTPGTTTVGSATNCFVYADGSSLLQCGTTFVANDSGSGSFVFTVLKSPSGSSATSNGLNLSGTFPTQTAATYAANYQITGSGSAAFESAAQNINLLAGYTGSKNTFGVKVTNASAGTGVNPLLNVGANFGGSFSASATTTGFNVGVHGLGNSGDRNYGGLFESLTSKASSINVGVAGIALDTAGTARIGGMFGALNPDSFTAVSAAVLIDNSSLADPLLVARDNGAALPTTSATATWSILDGGNAQAGNLVLTSATMAAETQALLIGAAIHSYTWTNAQVAALAGTAGDITVATLPAKTGVRNAYVVITGAAAGPATVTVSCGDAIGGTPFINYVGVSDAKAAANTVYGDAVAERGTSIDVEFYYLPSYTATTLVTCHFISTGANLSTVTGSTGRVVLETFLIP